MAIEFNCPQCGAAIRVPDVASGAKGSCPTCQTKLLVPQVAPPPQPVVSAPPTPDVTVPPAPVPPAPVPPAPVPPAPVPPALADPVLTVATPNQLPGQIPTATPDVSPLTEQAFPQLVNPTDPVQFPRPPSIGTGQPIVPAAASIAASVRRRSKPKTSGLWFPVLCGIALVGGMSWLYVLQLPSLNGDRTASFIKNEALKPKVVEKELVDVSDDVRNSVLNHFAENRERLKSQLVETQFTATNAGLEIQILTGSDTRFVRFPIDDDLRAWYGENYDLLASPRSKAVRKALKSFFKDWDVAARNQQGVEDFAVYRDSVGLACSVDGLGFNVCAKIDQTLYPCVYEDDGFLYFLLPPSTRKFKVVGARSNGKKSQFPGEYNVTIKSARD